MTQSTVKCTHCETQVTAWCADKCTHYSTKSTEPAAKQTQKPQLPQKREHTGGKIPKAVYCLDTKTWYISARDAADKLGICENGIHRACSGYAKLAGNMRWMKDNDPGLPKGAQSKLKRNKHPEKPVLHIDTNTRYESVIEAAKALGYGKTSAYRYVNPTYQGKNKLIYIETEEQK